MYIEYVYSTVIPCIHTRKGVIWLYAMYKFRSYGARPIIGQVERWTVIESSLLSFPDAAYRFLYSSSLFFYSSLYFFGENKKTGKRYIRVCVLYYATTKPQTSFVRMPNPCVCVCGCGVFINLRSIHKWVRYDDISQRSKPLGCWRFNSFFFLWEKKEEENPSRVRAVSYSSRENNPTLDVDDTQRESKKVRR